MYLRVKKFIIQTRKKIYYINFRQLFSHQTYSCQFRVYNNNDNDNDK